MGYCKLDFHSAWDLGLDAIKVYDELIKKEPEYLSFPFNDSGNYYMRTSWNKESKYLHYKKFITITCTRCGYIELYKAKSDNGWNILDFLMG